MQSAMPSAKSDKTCVSGRGRHKKCETNVLKNRKADRLYTDSHRLTDYYLLQMGPYNY